MAEPVILFHYHLAQEFPAELERMHQLFPDHHFVVAHGEEEFHHQLPTAQVIIAPPQPATVLDRAASLRAHIVPFAGVNRVPVSWYIEHEVLLASSHGNADAVAERAVALMYAAAGRIVEFDHDLRQGRWHRRQDPVQPFDYWRSLTGSRVAVLGTGAIGCRIAALVAPLVGGHPMAGSAADNSVNPGIDGEIVGFNRGNSAPGEENRPASRIVTAESGAAGEMEARHPERAFGRLTTNLPTAIAGADVVFVALPLTTRTRGILTHDLLQATNQATLVNVSRAEIIPEDQLYQALTDSTLYAAGLDVWYRHPEPFWDEGPQSIPGTQPFHTLSNVVLSPHAASHSRRGKQAQFRGALSHLEEYLKTGTLSRTVDMRRGY